MTSPDWKIALPITGIKTSIAPVNIGPISIIRLDCDTIPDCPLENIKSLAIALDSDTKFETDSLFDVVEYLEDALSILRVFVSKRLHGLAALNIISKRKLWTYSEIYSLNAKDPSQSKRTGLYPGGRIYEYRLTSEDIELYISNSIETFLYILLKLHKKESVSPLDELVTKSLTWCGLMLEDVFYRDRFLRGVTALETLIEKSSAKGISFKFRTIGSKLFCLSNPQFPIRQIEQSLKKIYKARCNISHGGEMAGNEFGESLEAVEYIITHICFSAIKLWKSSSSVDEFYSKIK